MQKHVAGCALLAAIGWDWACIKQHVACPIVECICYMCELLGCSQGDKEEICP